eukprot:9740517-Karenia_brevis.AAC.1
MNFCCPESRKNMLDLPLRKLSHCCAVTAPMIHLPVNGAGPENRGWAMVFATFNSCKRNPAFSWTTCFVFAV